MTDDDSAAASGRRRFGRRQVLGAGAAALGTAAAATALYKGGARLLTPRPGNDLAPVARVVPTRIVGNDAYPVWYRRPLPLDSPPARYPGFRPGKTVLRKGSIRREGAMPLPCDIVFERDVAVKMRDGTTIYTDVFRPAVGGRHPAIMGWSPYGKQFGGQWLDDIPYRANVPLALVSELQKFEGPDPAFFCNHGYAVISPDARGAYSSEGNINFWGRQPAEDGHDVIEWAATQPWCSGRIGMAGNSWLAISQWFIAATRPPHLAAIAPWEGADAKYLPGGIPIIAFDEIIVQSFAGKNLVEDLPKMSLLHPFMDDYWRDKAAAIEDIAVPAYVVASYTNIAHTHGTFDAFRRLASPKWLRVHNTQEWQDFYNPVYRADLLRFFDHVLKGIDNGWAATPSVRLSVLDPGRDDIIDRPEAEWPLARQRPFALHLRGDRSLSPVRDPAAASLRYDVTDENGLTFLMRFDRDVEVTGYMSLKLWVEADGAADMDLAVEVEKLDVAGGRYDAVGPPGTHIIANGLLRVSHRQLDAARSTASEPVQLHLSEALLRPGEIVPIEVGIWPMATMFHAGEQLSLKIIPFGAAPFPGLPFEFGSARISIPQDGGTFMPGEQGDMDMLGGPGWTKPRYCADQAVAQPTTRNKGQHIVHVGGRYDSRLLIPVIPGSAQT